PEPPPAPPDLETAEENFPQLVRNHLNKLDDQGRWPCRNPKTGAVDFLRFIRIEPGTVGQVKPKVFSARVVFQDARQREVLADATADCSRDKWRIVALELAAPPPARPRRRGRHESDVDIATYQAKESPDRFALVIGVETYPYLPKADFAERDAQAMRTHLEHLGYPARNIILLRGDQAVRSAIEKYVETWLPKNAKKGARVFVYFAGHGAPDPQSGQAYLMPWDGDPQRLAETGYPVKQLYAALNALAAGELFVVLAACFSGAGGRSVPAQGARPLLKRVDIGRDLMGRAVVFAATGSDEITVTAPGQGHGLFTYYFLKGLNGAAGSSRDGITVWGLFEYVALKVQDAAQRGNRAQSPQLFLTPDGQLQQLLIQDLR
ncbi:MAG: caspase family protein, partial [Elusimicrobia bacterium]|nr:caspase family protein [Elusimicrobiota bacterium]